MLRCDLADLLILGSLIAATATADVLETFTEHPATIWSVWVATRTALLTAYSEYLSDVRFYAETAARAWGAISDPSD